MLHEVFVGDDLNLSPDDDLCIPTEEEIEKALKWHREHL